MTRQTTRRNFLIASATVAAGIVGCGATKSHSTPVAQEQLPVKTAILERELGRTGISVPILGLGGAGKTPVDKTNREQQAIAMTERALSLGIRYFDTAASYGASEQHFGRVLPSYRNQVFLATKTGARDRDGAWRDLERSLKRLNTDYLDLWQLHHVSFEQELDRIFSKDGAIQAMEEAKQQNILRLTGITGHHEPDVIVEGLRRYEFDTTLIPINAADKHHPRPFIPKVLPVAQQQGVGVIAMKVPAYGRLFKPGVLDGMHQALGYTLSQAGVHCAIVAAENIAQLESNVEVARAFEPLSQKALADIEQRTAASWKDNTFFRAWS
ncbi:MAG: aldo/keto reductase [Symploca sp. SIO3C6]|nr:aldo/keto reductase [Symploca sp. SIO3C6]